MKSLLLVLTASLLMCAAGCKSSASKDEFHPVNPIANVRGQLTPLRMTISTDPAKPSYDKPTTLRVHVIDASDQPVTDATVKAEVSMPGMEEHGKKDLALTSRGNGDYEGSIDFEMDGAWNVNVSVQRADKQIQQTYSVQVGG